MAGSGFALYQVQTLLVLSFNALTANTIALDNGSNDWTATVTSNNLIFSYAGTAKDEVKSFKSSVTGDTATEGTI